MVGTPPSTPAVERSCRIDELFFGLTLIVVFIEPAPVGSFNPPIGGAAWRVAHDEHPSVAVVRPFTEDVGFDAVRARPAAITLVAIYHLFGLSAEAHVPVDLHRRGGNTKHPISAVSGNDQLIVGLKS